MLEEVQRRFEFVSEARVGRSWAPDLHNGGKVGMSTAGAVLWAAVLVGRGTWRVGVDM